MTIIDNIPSRYLPLTNPEDGVMDPSWYVWFSTANFLLGAVFAENNLSDLDNISDARNNLDVPDTTGTGATGTWAIQITGNAASAFKLVDTSGDDSLTVLPTTAATSVMQVRAGTAANPPGFKVESSDSDMDFLFGTKGSGSFVFVQDSSNAVDPVVFWPNGLIGASATFTWGSLGANRTYTFPDSTGTVQIDTLDVGTTAAGKGFKCKEGSDCRMGTATLVGGTVTVTNVSVTASTRIFVSRSTTGGTAGHLSTTQIASTSFTINSSSGTDTSTINWLLVEPT